MASVVVIKDALHTPANPATPTVGVVTADDARLSQAATWARSSTGVGARTGVVYAGNSVLLTGTATTAPSMTVAVAALHFVAQKAAAEGVYVGASPGVVLLDVAAAPGANSRIDVVYAMQRDAASPTSPDALTQAELGVVTGTAGVSPAKPAIPVGAVEVGTVTVAAGATATTNGTVTVATTCAWTVPLGAPIPVRSQSERDAITPGPGTTVDRLDLGRTERWSGTVWTESGSASFIRMRATADQGFGAGVWTNMVWAQDGTVRGPAGILSAAGGGVTVAVAGLYRVAIQFSAAALASSTTVEVRLVSAGTTLCQAWGAFGNAGLTFAISASADVVLPAGAVVGASVYNSAGTITIRSDVAGTPCGFTVTRIPG